jgi:hypothetical protein
MTGEEAGYSLVIMAMEFFELNGAGTRCGTKWLISAMFGDTGGQMFFVFFELDEPRIPLSRVTNLLWLILLVTSTDG